MNPIPHTTISHAPASGHALEVKRFFTSPGTHPFDAVEWQQRAARIGHGDRVAFEQENVEFPKSWAQNATNIVAGDQSAATSPRARTPRPSSTS